jgi:hypothetical protein
LRLTTAGGYVALVLATSFGIAFNLFTIAVLYTAIENDAPLSENATQVLTGWGGGIIGVVGSYIGYRVGISELNQKEERNDLHDE